MAGLERVTVTMDRSLLTAVDGLVAGGGAKSRSHAMDLLLRKALATAELHKALILAGGTREALAMPSGFIKPLVEIAGVPLIERSILALKRFGITDFTIAVGYGGEQIVSRLQNGESLGVRISYVWEPPEAPVGGAGCLRLAQEQLSEPFILMYSDVLFDALDLADLYSFHKANNGLCTLLLANAEKATPFGVAKMSGSKIVEFSEKPSAAQGHLVNAGIAICEPTIFSFIPRKPHYSFEHELLPAIAKRGKLVGYVHSGPWFDIGKHNGLAEAQAYFAKK